MKRFRFRLEKVLSLTLSEEKAAEIELGRARRREEQERARLRQIETALGRVLRASRDLERRPASIAEIKKHRDYLKKLNADRDRQGQVLAQAAQVTAEKLAALLETRKKRKTLENLKARRQADYFRESLAEEQKALDEVGGRGARRTRTPA